MAVRRLLPPTDPEHDDLVRTALACVVAALAARPPQAGYSERWLVAVARGVSFERVQERAVERGAAPDNPADGAGGEPPTQVREKLRRLALGLGRVGQSNALMVIEHDVRGRDLAEIAASLGISLTVAQSRLVRGRRALLERLRRAL
jgi:DNA-directed RNA polymerase specialized sigma24 family protein